MNYSFTNNTDMTISFSKNRNFFLMQKHNHTLPGVSVIIPVYNRPEFLKEAVESVLNQSYRDFEVIVVDDGSTDSTPDVIDSYRGIIRSVRQENMGVSAARNTGIRASRNNLVAFLDSDDLWETSKLERHVAFFNEHPEALICQTGEIWIRKGKRVNPGTRHQKPSGMIFNESLHLCLVSPSAVMMKKTVFEKVGFFNESFPACEDYDLWLRISCSIPVFLLDEPLVIKRGGHENQLSAMSCLDRYRIFSIKNILDSGRLDKDQTIKAVSVLVEKCRIYSSGCMKRGREEESAQIMNIACEYFDKAIK